MGSLKNLQVFIYSKVHEKNHVINISRWLSRRNARVSRNQGKLRHPGRALDFHWSRPNPIVH